MSQPGDPAARAGRRLAGWVGAGARDVASGLARGVAGGVRWPDHEIRRVQRRTLGTLVVAQSLGGVGITIGIAVAAILAEDLSGSESLAGLAQTSQVLGAALASFLLAHLMGRRGRRAGLVLGYLIGAAGAALCVVAGVVEIVPAPAGRRHPARRHDGREQPVPLRRHRPGPAGPPGAVALAGRVGDHHRRGRRAQPHRGRRPGGPVDGAARPHRALPLRAAGDPGGGPGGVGVPPARPAAGRAAGRPGPGRLHRPDVDVVVAGPARSCASGPRSVPASRRSLWGTA